MIADKYEPSSLQMAGAICHFDPGIPLLDLAWQATYLIRRIETMPIRDDMPVFVEVDGSGRNGVEAGKEDGRRRGALVPLFVIRQRGRDLYWTCSTEHASGWHPNYPKQSFTKSELSREIFRLIDQGWFTDIEVLQLAFAH